MPAHESLRGFRVSRLVGRTDLFTDRTRLSSVAHGLVHGAACFRAPNVGLGCAVRHFYAAILQGRHLRWFAQKRVAALCILAFSAAISVLWAINFVSQTRPV